jgi:hypothetical protein
LFFDVLIYSKISTYSIIFDLFLKKFQINIAVLDLNEQGALAVTDSKAEVSTPVRPSPINSPFTTPGGIQTASKIKKETKMRTTRKGPIMKLPEAMGGPTKTPFANFSPFVLVLL